MVIMYCHVSFKVKKQLVDVGALKQNKPCWRNVYLTESERDVFLSLLGSKPETGHELRCIGC